MPVSQGLGLPAIEKYPVHLGGARAVLYEEQLRRDHRLQRHGTVHDELGGQPWCAFARATEGCPGQVSALHCRLAVTRLYDES